MNGLKKDFNYICGSAARALLSTNERMARLDQQSGPIRMFTGAGESKTEKLVVRKLAITDSQQHSPPPEITG